MLLFFSIYTLQNQAFTVPPKSNIANYRQCASLRFS